MNTLSSVKEKEMINKLRFPILVFLFKLLILGTSVYYGEQEQGVSTEFPDTTGEATFVIQVLENHWVWRIKVRN